MGIKSLVLAFVAVLVAIPSVAQGIFVHKKNGERVAFQFEEIDSIVPYNSEESPEIPVDVYTVNGVSFTMLPVEGGTFSMGATPEQFNGYTPNSGEKPTHVVTLSSFYMAETEVTQALWYAVMGQKPTLDGFQWVSTYGLGNNYPAYYISYTDCQEFITKLNGLTGQTFRMPTEAEWEYAARGGQKSKGYIFSGSDSIEDVAWYNSNSGSTAHAVKSKAANELGLYDMSGNMMEWCSDWHGRYGSAHEVDPKGPTTGARHVLRGGDWEHKANYCRVSNRDFNGLTVRSCCYGLRLALDNPQSVSPQSSEIIKFRNVQNKGTRSVALDNLGLYYVSGCYTKSSDLNTCINVFADTPVVKGEGNDWNSSFCRYWIDGATYSFYAYSCENKHIAPEYGGTSFDMSDGIFRLNYTCHTEEGVSHDLVFACATDILGKETDNQPVPMQFEHILSKVNFNFVSDFPEGYIVEISNITISQFKNTGIFTANKKAVSDGTLGSWGSVEYDKESPNTFILNTRGNSTTSFGKDAEGNPKPPVASSSCYMIPCDYADSRDTPVKIQFNIKVTDPALAAGSQTVLSNTLSYTCHPNWRMGMQYTYTIRLSGDAAGMDATTFDVGVNDWNNPLGITIW